LKNHVWVDDKNTSDPQTAIEVGMLKFRRKKTDGNDRKRGHDDDDNETSTVTARRDDVTTNNGARTSDCCKKSVRTGWPALSGGPDHGRQRVGATHKFSDYTVGGGGGGVIRDGGARVFGDEVGEF